MGARSGKTATSAAAVTHSRCDLCGAESKRGEVVVRGGEACAEECSRCHRYCCPKCITWRRFGSRFATYEDDERVAEFTPVCARCLAQTNLVLNVPRSVWAILNEYCDPTSKHRLLQLCHATQMGVVLAYPYTRYGWSTFFKGKTFISKGANGEVYKTTLRKDIGSELSKTVAGDMDMSMITTLGGTTVAVKAIRKSTIFSLRKWEHIKREVDTLRKCRHCHVVQLHFVAQGPSEVYIVLQYVSGGDLFDWLVRQQIPMEYDVMVIAQQLLETLHYMHEVCSVVHRDIKPENILLQPVAGHRLHQAGSEAPSIEEGGLDGTFSSSDELYIRIADFGYAKMLPHINHTASPSSPARAGRPHLPPLRPPTTPITTTTYGGVGAAAGTTAVIPENRRPVESQLNNRKAFLISSTPCGTLGFAAPEILSAYDAQKSASQRLRANRNSADALDSLSQPQTPVDFVKRMDIFAAGVTICILLTGCEPFPCVSSKEHMEAVQSGLDFSGPQWNYVSQPAKNLLRRMLAPKAVDRPSALECLHSSWLKRNDAYADTTSEVDDYDDIAHGKGIHHSNSVWQLLSTSFQNSVRSLRKNEGWLFVQDSQGLVTTIPRQLVNENEDVDTFPEALRSTDTQHCPTAIY
jgi:serine/threonine protein kinase